MNNTNNLIKRIRDLGFIISNDNKDVETTNELAERYYKEHYEGRGYILGSVPANNESLEHVEYDIAFSIVEEKVDYLTNEEYEYFHKEAESNNLDLFSKIIEASNLEVELIREILDDITEWKRDITFELEEIISDLGKPSWD